MALDGVGPSMARGSQAVKGSCADLAMAVRRTAAAITQAISWWPAMCSRTSSWELRSENGTLACQKWWLIHMASSRPTSAMR